MVMRTTMMKTTASFHHHHRRLLLLLLLLVLLLCLDTVQARRKVGRMKKPKPSLTPRKTFSTATWEPVKETVVQRGLVNEDVHPHDVLHHHNRYYHNTSARVFLGETLAYVTPWNNHGYDVAKVFGSKFTYVSPVWFQIKSQGKMAILQGAHDVDAGWIRDVRRATHQPLLVPRFQLDGWSPDVIRSLLVSKDQRLTLADKLVNECRKHGFDGLVLELWDEVGYSIVESHREELHTLIQEIGAALHRHDMKLIVVIPPIRGTYAMFDTPDFDALVDHVDRFSLMTYDFSGVTAGPNAPIRWMHKAVSHLCATSPHRSNQILLGLNFYGYDYTFPNGKTALLGREFVSLMERHTPILVWDDRHAEHSFEFYVGAEQHKVYYPTLQSIQTRLDLASEMGTGLAIWEVGQGLDFFFDLV